MPPSGGTLTHDLEQEQGTRRPLLCNHSDHLRSRFCRVLPTRGLAQDRTFSPEKRTQIEAAVSKFMAVTHVPGLSVAVVESGEYEWAAGFGLADVENNAPASEHTLFRLASISKPLTATAAMQLWERSHLDLDAPVQKYCPAFPREALAHPAPAR